MRSVYGNHERFENTYFKKFPGFYVTGDGKSHKGHGQTRLTDRTEQDDESSPDSFTSYQNFKFSFEKHFVLQAADGIKTVITGSQEE